VVIDQLIFEAAPEGRAAMVSGTSRIGLMARADDPPAALQNGDRYNQSWPVRTPFLPSAFFLITSRCKAWQRQVLVDRLAHGAAIRGECGEQLPRFTTMLDCDRRLIILPLYRAG
jgi:hypothetical protein